jgi:hypothetical protein
VQLACCHRRHTARLRQRLRLGLRARAASCVSLGGRRGARKSIALLPRPMAAQWLPWPPSGGFVHNGTRRSRLLLPHSFWKAVPSQLQLPPLTPRPPALVTVAPAFPSALSCSLCPVLVAAPSHCLRAVCSLAARPYPIIPAPCVKERRAEPPPHHTTQCRCPPTTSMKSPPSTAKS